MVTLFLISSTEGCTFKCKAASKGPCLCIRNHPSIVCTPRCSLSTANTEVEESSGTADLLSPLVHKLCSVTLYYSMRPNCKSRGRACTYARNVHEKAALTIFIKGLKFAIVGCYISSSYQRLRKFILSMVIQVQIHTMPHYSKLA